MCSSFGRARDRTRQLSRPTSLQTSERPNARQRQPTDTKRDWGLANCRCAARRRASRPAPAASRARANCQQRLVSSRRPVPTIDEPRSGGMSCANWRRRVASCRTRPRESTTVSTWYARLVVDGRVVFGTQLAVGARITATARTATSHATSFYDHLPRVVSSSHVIDRLLLAINNDGDIIGDNARHQGRVQQQDKKQASTVVNANILMCP